MTEGQSVRRRVFQLREVGEEGSARLKQNVAVLDVGLRHLA